MPEVKMQNRHCACSIPRGIQWYIEEKREGRCLARAFLNVRARDERNWARAFDRWRMAEGNHLPYHGLPAVQYVHAQIAPDPKDDVSVDEMLSFAKDWAAHWFGSGFEAGRLGCFQVAIGIHDDSENGIMHAHLVVNNTDVLTGGRLHLAKKENRRAKDHAQDMAREKGWHYFDYTKDQRWIKAESAKPYGERLASLPLGTPPTIAERRMAERGRGTWKSALRDRVFSSKAISRTEEEFIEACGSLDVSVEERAGDYLYSLDWEGERRSSMGASLGSGWKGKGVEGRRTVAKQMPREDAAALRRNVLKAFSEAREWRVSAPGVAEHEIASALMTMHRWRVWTPDGLDRALKKCAGRLNAVKGKERDAIKARYSQLLEAKATVAKAGLLVGVEPGSDRSQMVTLGSGANPDMGILGGAVADPGSRSIEPSHGRGHYKGR